MKQYEITYISDPLLTEEVRHELDVTIETKITEFAGAIEKSIVATRRRLIYPIKKKVNGFLRTINIQLDPAKLIDVQHFLKREGNILRFTIINTIPRGVVAQDIVDRHSIQKKGAAKKKPEKSITRAPKKDVKPVSMEDVEKGIEEALTEKVE